jgi:MYXO-CTERM domain-containing protein
MKIKFNRVIGFMASVAFCSAAQAVDSPLIWINEFHYDNTGTDSGEFIEVVIAPGGPAAANVLITLYNGGDTLSYNSLNLGSATLGANVSGYQFYVWSLPSNGIQNGAPDGIALTIIAPANVDQFLSYEGTFTAGNGAATGTLSTDIGISQSGSEPVGSSLGLVGTGGDQSAFTWAAFNNPAGGNGATPGQLNVGQQLPAPGALALLGLAGLVGSRRRRA